MRKTRVSRWARSSSFAAVKYSAPGMASPSQEDIKGAGRHSVTAVAIDPLNGGQHIYH